MFFTTLDNRLMKNIFIFSIAWGIILGIMLIILGILSSYIFSLLYGILAISSSILVLITPFKIFKVLNIINIVISICSFNIACLIYSLVLTIYYKKIKEEEENIAEENISIDDNIIKNIKISTIMSMFYIVIYVTLLTLFFVFYWQDVYSLFKSMYSGLKDMGLAAIIVGFFLILIQIVLISFIGFFCILPIIILYMNMLINYRALKYRRFSFFEILVRLGILSLTFTNAIAAKKVLNSTSNN